MLEVSSSLTSARDAVDILDGLMMPLEYKMRRPLLPENLIVREADTSRYETPDYIPT